MIFRLLAYIAAFGFIFLLTVALHRLVRALRRRVIAQIEQRG